jgi:RHS repeat-associated protein
MTWIETKLHRHSPKGMTTNYQKFDMRRYRNSPKITVTKLNSYGVVSVLDDAFASRTISDYDWEFRHTGRRTDLETGLQYFRARYYSPELGRFVSRDPLGFVDGMSLYRAYFVPGEVDPWGLEATKLSCNNGSCVEDTPPEDLPCKGNGCEFEIEVVIRPGTDLPQKLCFHQSPGEPLPDAPPVPGDQCTSEINRTNKNDFFELIMRDGTRCRITDQQSPPDAPWPLDMTGFPRICQGAVIDLEQIPGGRGGCYVFSELVIGIKLDFSLDISCGCSADSGRGHGTLDGKGDFGRAR